ncbi:MULTISPECIES: hypothetical protein [unclassified Mesorhizobium]|uniref:hypothetical protein n=1 Tax=unclassified Mesorhizobium TaxID=325217 RepID=UPI0012DBF699|nr:MULTISPECIES: hypothetical protein [unclassified Mesorhizobium]WJI50155.1 hypothetical protein NLY44_26760 [Mesorhizobium sp. C089B]
MEPDAHRPLVCAGLFRFGNTAGLSPLGAMEQLRKEMQVLADPGIWVALAALLIPYAIGVALLLRVAG